MSDYKNTIDEAIEALDDAISTYRVLYVTHDTRLNTTLQEQALSKLRTLQADYVLVKKADIPERLADAVEDLNFHGFLGMSLDNKVIIKKAAALLHAANSEPKPKEKPCWLCKGTGYFGGVDGDHIKCKHPPDTREYNERGHLIVREKPWEKQNES
jgi:hypothetical protein